MIVARDSRGASAWNAQRAAWCAGSIRLCCELLRFLAIPCQHLHHQ